MHETSGPRPWRLSAIPKWKISPSEILGAALRHHHMRVIKHVHGNNAMGLMEYESRLSMWLEDVLFLWNHLGSDTHVRVGSKHPPHKINLINKHNVMVFVH